MELRGYLAVLNSIPTSETKLEKINTTDNREQKKTVQQHNQKEKKMKSDISSLIH